MNETENDRPGTMVVSLGAQRADPVPHSDIAPGLPGSDNEMISSLHWFPWYPNRWLSSMSVKCMSINERGAYRELLDWQWQGQGYLPEDVTTISRLAGFDASKFPCVLAKFPVIKPGKRANSVLLKIWNDQQVKHARRSLSGNKRWKNKETERDTEENAHALHDAKHDALHDDFSFMEELRKLYTWVDFDKELAKMKGFFLTPKGKGRKLTRRFMVNWLNRCDRPLGPQQIRYDSGPSLQSRFDGAVMDIVERLEKLPPKEVDPGAFSDYLSSCRDKYKDVLHIKCGQPPMGLIDYALDVFKARKEGYGIPKGTESR